MRTILIISYGWPPHGGVGMLRIVKFAKYLTAAGYEVHVMTKEDEIGGTIDWDMDDPLLSKVFVHRIKPEPVLSIGAKIKGKVLSMYEMDWLMGAEKNIDSIIAGIDFDVIFSSSPPEAAHFLAHSIKEKYNKPWVADLRDLWAMDHYRDYGFVRKNILINVEKNILSFADRIITVSTDWQKTLGKIYGDKTYVITNGFDPEHYHGKRAAKDSVFRISYLGKLNAEYQDVMPLIYALKEFIDNKGIQEGALKLDFYVSGYGKPDIRKIAMDNGLSGFVHEYPPVPFSRALQIMQNSDVLLITGWNGPSGKGWRPQKVYEYIGAGKTILIVNSTVNTELKELVSRLGIGYSADSSEEIKMRLSEMYDNFISQGSVMFKPNDGLVNGYRADVITAQLAEIFEEVCK